MESVLLRARKSRAEHYAAITQIFCADALCRIETSVKTALAATLEGDELQTHFDAHKDLMKNSSPGQHNRHPPPSR